MPTFEEQVTEQEISSDAVCKKTASVPMADPAALVKPPSGKDRLTFFQPIFDQIAQEPEAGPLSYPANDIGNAQRFRDFCDKSVRYCAAEKRWYYFDSSVWKPDTTNLMTGIASVALDNSYKKEAEYLKLHGDFNEIKQNHRNHLKAGNMSSIQNCLNAAALHLTLRPEQFDAHPYLFHLQNGTVNLRANCEQEYEAHLFPEPQLLITKTANAVLQTEDPGCPRWEAFVRQCCMDDEELYDYLQKAAGYSILTGEIHEQKVFCLLGAGRNGKSLFINTLAHFAGNYASKLESSILCVNRFGEKDNDTSKELYRIRGSRFVYSNEFSRTSTLNESFIKAITDGGNLSCRPLYGSAIEYKPTYTLWFSTNHMPNLQAMDEGIARRIVVIPFRHHLEEQDADRQLPEKLLEEADGIFYWLMEGYHQYTLNGLQAPAAVKEATASYFEKQDLIQLFLDDCYTVDPDNKTYTKHLYQQYVQWCSENGEKAIGRNKLYEELEQRLGIEKKNNNKGYYYHLKPIE